jgi:cytochrome c553
MKTIPPKHISIINSMRRKLALAACLSLLAGAGFGAEVAENWTKHCMKCHGKDGKGGTKMGRQSGVKDYTDPKIQAGMKDEDAFKSIRAGIKDNGKEKMKPYGGELSDDEVRALIAYIRAFHK